MSSWYGKTSSKQLDSLLDKKPKLAQLLLCPQFLNQLKAYNTKLLDYLSNNPSLMGEAVQYLTVPPSQNDSDERKFKLPMMCIQMIQTEATCIHNALFKQSSDGKTYFQSLFKLLDNQQILPILAGYLHRVNTSLLGVRTKQTIDKFYSITPSIFPKLIEHSHIMSISSIIQLYLNIQINKYPSPSSSQDPLKLKSKLSTLSSILLKIELQSTSRSQKSTTSIENLSHIVCQTIQKYYLIHHGKQMMEIITAEKSISMWMGMVKGYVVENAFPAFNFFISLINYYSFSSFNVDELGNEEGKKNLERLESQPMIVELVAYFGNALERIMRSPSMSLYLYRLLEVLCHCISISSLRIFQCTRKTQFFSNLVKLMFTHQKHNILHVLVEKSFLHIFISERKIYQQYKKHLFCQIDIIDSTAGYFMKQFPLQRLFQQGKKKAYFGHFMRILKIYSGIQTQDQAIIQAIKSKSQLWNKISKHLIIPYQNIYEKKLGTYQQVPQPVYQQFKVDKNLKIKPNPMKNSTIQQINKEENVPMTAKTQIQTDLYTKMSEMEQKKAEEMFYRTPIQGFLANNDIMNSSSLSNNSKNPPASSSSINAHPSSSTSSISGTGTGGGTSPSYSALSAALNTNQTVTRQNPHMSQSNVVDYQTTNLKKSESFKEFMDKKKVEAQQQIKLKRSLSQQRRLSGNNARMASPSPSRRINNWRQNNEDQNSTSTKLNHSQLSSNQNQSQNYQSQRKIQVPVPKIPLNRKPGAQGSVSDRLHTSVVTVPTQSILTSPSSATTPIINPSVNINSNTSTNPNININVDAVSNGRESNEIKDIKNFRIFRIQKPAEKKYRRIDENDRPLLEFLGLNVI